MTRTIEIADVFIFRNRNIAVCNKRGAQVPKLQNYTMDFAYPDSSDVLRLNEWICENGGDTRKATFHVYNWPKPVQVAYTERGYREYVGHNESRLIHPAYLREIC